MLPQLPPPPRVVGRQQLRQRPLNLSLSPAVAAAVVIAAAAAAVVIAAAAVVVAAVAAAVVEAVAAVAFPTSRPSVI